MSLITTLRTSHKARLWLIGILLAIAVAIFFFVKGTFAKAIVGVVIVTLLAAFGLEASKTDYDLGKAIKERSLSAARIERDEKGNISNVEAFCDAKEADYNCADFKTQQEAMTVYNRCKAKGKNMDVYGLDRDHDGKVCEALPVGAQ